MTTETKYAVLIDTNYPPINFPILLKRDGPKLYEFHPGAKEWRACKGTWESWDKGSTQVGLETSSFTEAIAYVLEDIARNRIPDGVVSARWMSVI